MTQRVPTCWNLVSNALYADKLRVNIGGYYVITPVAKTVIAIFWMAWVLKGKLMYSATHLNLIQTGKLRIGYV